MNISLSDKTFNKIRCVIDAELGIKMSELKRVMVESRLQKRLRFLGLDNFEEYSEYLSSDQGKANELFDFFDEITTNKTDFFREKSHFDYLTNVLLPELIVKKRLNEIRIWSCACSSGQEPYTLAIVLEEFKIKNPGFNYYIMASDISTKVLLEAKKAVYKEEFVNVIPYGIRQKYFLRGKGDRKNLYRVIPKLRDNVRFGRLNLMNEKYNIPGGPFDIIFFRNALIYFERSRQARIVDKVCTKLNPGGGLFLGHSESILGMNTPLKSEGTAIYKKI